MNRETILDTAETLINGERDHIYGSAVDNFTLIAALWSPILGVTVTAEQIAICQTLVKFARLANTPGHEDSWIDAAGYIALGGEIATEAAAAAKANRRPLDLFDVTPRVADLPAPVKLVEGSGTAIAA